MTLLETANSIAIFGTAIPAPDPHGGCSAEGDGWVFVHAGGTVVERELKPGEELHVDTGCLVAMTPDVDFDVVTGKARCSGRSAVSSTATIADALAGRSLCSKCVAADLIGADF